jgi:glycosyltransferase involved in cell wall biosynthesis
VRTVRVLIAHNRYRDAGGEERHVKLLESGLSDEGLEVRRFERDSAELDNSLPKRLAAGVSLAYRPGGGGIASALSPWRPDVVHFHNIWPLLTPAALRLAKRQGAAVVLTLHNYRFACPGGTCPTRDQPLDAGALSESCIEGSAIRCALAHNPRNAIMQSCAYGVALEAQRRLHLIARWADALVVPSEFMGHMARLGGLPKQRLCVIHHGLPFADAGPLGGRFALFFGRLTVAKGVETLIAAARIAPEVPLVFAGEGPLEDEIRRTKITYVGRLDRARMAKTLADSAFAVAPSEWHEPFGYSALEALAAGKPVIATVVGGLPEIVTDGETGLLVPPRSPEALAEAMRTLWHDRGLALKLGTSALRVARERFSLTDQIAKTIALYEAVISQQPRRLRGATSLH